jgi:hypothetical protein
LQIDFGTVRVPVADEPLKVHLFVPTLGIVLKLAHELASCVVHYAT